MNRFNIRLRQIGTGFICLFATCCWTAVGAIAAPTAPAPIQDHAGLLSGDGNTINQTLQEYVSFLLREFDIDLQVYTSRIDDNINLQAFSLYQQLAVGRRSKSLKGMLLIVNPVINKVRFEVGYELEDVYQDAFVSYIEHRQMVPYFNQNQVPEGIVAAIELIVTRAQHAKLGKTENVQPWLEGSGGAGAAADANINQKQVPIAHSLPDELKHQLENLSPEQSPQDVINLMFEKTRHRITDWTLPIFASSTRSQLRDRKATVAQMDNGVRVYDACGKPTIQLDRSGYFAVARYRPDQRLCAPWFLMKEDGIWRLDILAHAYGLRNNFSNEWFFDGTTHDNPMIYPYWFAFNDWYITKKGYFYMYRWQVTVATERGCPKDFSVLKLADNMGASKFGMKVGDIPVRFYGEDVKHKCHFLALLRKPKAGERLEADVMRGGKRIRLSGLAPEHVGGMNGKKMPNYSTIVAAWKKGVSAATGIELTP